MTIQGFQFIGGEPSKGTHGQLFGADAATGERLEPAFGGASASDLEAACAQVEAAFDAFRELPLSERAALLDRIGDNIVAIGDELIQRCCAESGLPTARIEGERARTVGQLRMFADVVREGSFMEARLDSAMPDRKPVARPDLRLRKVPLGPVAVFGASNFPLAFSVAGGDTASALAAGCPVVVKAHSAHPGTSELVGAAVAAAVRDLGMPRGVFSLLFDSGRAIGQGLVADPRIQAVGFTGSRTGGTALMRISAARPRPIPVYAEMSSINPVILFPEALAERGAAIGKAFAASLTLGAGQFCTNPGLVVAIEGEGFDAFMRGAAEGLAASPAAVMLTRGILESYREGVRKVREHPAVESVAEGKPGDANHGQARLFSVSASDFLASPELQDEVFGASSLVVRCADFDAIRTVLASLEGQLTVALHVGNGDLATARSLLPSLERLAGRLLVNNFGTGVEVSHAMVHGGPVPSTSDGRSTSVGSLAIDRFLRPVCYQDMPQELLPDALRDGNPLGLWRRLDGTMTRG